MPDVDLFNFFSWLLTRIVWIYFIVITAQSLWNWYVWLAGGEKHVSMLRRYLLVHGLRLRFTSFWGDVLVCLLLGVVFLAIWRAQLALDYLEANLPHVHQRVHARNR